MRAFTTKSEPNMQSLDQVTMSDREEKKQQLHAKILEPVFKGRGDVKKPDAEMKDVYNPDRVTFPGDDNDSIITTVGSPTPSLVSSDPSDFNSASSTVSSRLYQGSPPPVPVGSPQIVFSTPVNGVGVAMALVDPEVLDIPSGLIPPPNSNASAFVRSGTLYHSQNPSPAASVTSETLFNPVPGQVSPESEYSAVPEGFLPGGHRLSAERLAQATKRKTTTGPFSPATIKSILKPERSSHSTDAERAAAQLLGLEGSAAALGNPVPLVKNIGAPVGTRERKMWIENIQEDLVRNLLRLKQAASDSHDVDPSRSIGQHYDRLLKDIIEKADKESEKIEAAKAAKKEAAEKEVVDNMMDFEVEDKVLI